MNAKSESRRLTRSAPPRPCNSLGGDEICRYQLRSMRVGEPPFSVSPTIHSMLFDSTLTDCDVAIWRTGAGQCDDIIAV